MSDSPATPTTSSRGKGFKPRAVKRKTVAEREEYARQEAERAKERAEQDAQINTKSARGGRNPTSTRGARGGNASRSDDRPTSSPSIFAAGTKTKTDRVKTALDVGTTEVLYGDKNETAKVKATVTDKTRAADTKMVATGDNQRGETSDVVEDVSKSSIEKEAVIESDEDLDDQPNRDIEKIWISSDGCDDEVIDAPQRKRKQKSASQRSKANTGLRPVRAARSIQDEDDFESREKTEKQTSTIKTQDESTTVDVDVNEMQVDDLPVSRKDFPSSPELSKKPTRRSSNKNKDPRIAIETAEEKSERLRLAADTQKLRERFATQSSTVARGRTGITASEDDNENRLFLFQLPPLVPALYDPARLPAPNEEEADVKIKPEPGINTSSTLNVAGAANKASEKVDARTQASDVFTAASPITSRLPPGHIGKLRIHASGKVTLDWGGTDMEVRYGTEVDFLQDAVLVETPADDGKTGEGMQLDEKGNVLEKRGELGQAYGLGQVRSKMVVVPDWGRLYG